MNNEEIITINTVGYLNLPDTYREEIGLIPPKTKTLSFYDKASGTESTENAQCVCITIFLNEIFKISFQWTEIHRVGSNPHNSSLPLIRKRIITEDKTQAKFSFGLISLGDKIGDDHPLNQWRGK